MPVLGKELSHVQFRSLEEQLFRSMAALFDQKQRQGVARLVGMSAPVSLITPTVSDSPTNPARIKRFLESRYKTLPFAITGTAATKLLAERSEMIREKMKALSDEPTTAKRKLKPPSAKDRASDRPTDT